MNTRAVLTLTAISGLLLSIASPALAEDDDDLGVSDGTCAVEGNPLSDFGHDLGSIFKKIGGGIADGAAESVGVLELAGVRYPVKAYQEQVSPTLWRGSRLDDRGFSDLASRGFKATVDLTLEHTGDAEMAPAHGMNTYNVPTLDNSHPTEAQMIGFLNFVTNPDNQPVYIHCEAGVGRTSIATAVYRMAVQGWSVDEALAEAEAHGMKVPNQVAFVQQFGADLAAGKFAADGFPPAVSPVPAIAQQGQVSGR